MLPFNVELSFPQIMIAVDIQTSNSILNWGGGERMPFFTRGKLLACKCNVKPYVSQLLLKVIVGALTDLK